MRNGQRVQSKNYCVRFQVKGKRTCRTLGTADFRLAQQRAVALVKSIREKGFEHALAVPGSRQLSQTLEHVLKRFAESATARGLRPRSIRQSASCLRTIAKEMGAARLDDLTGASIQSWIEQASKQGLSRATIHSKLRSAGSIFSQARVPVADVGGEKLDKRAAAIAAGMV